MASDKKQSKICSKKYPQIICKFNWKNYKYNYRFYGIWINIKSDLEVYTYKNDNAMGYHNREYFFPCLRSNNRNKQVNYVSQF